MNLENMMLSEKPGTKGHTACGPMYVTCSEQAQPETGSSCQGLGSRLGVTAKGDRASFGVMECSGIGMLHNSLKILKTTDMSTVMGELCGM